MPLPSDRKPVRCKWVYQKMTNLDGSIVKFKSRLVAKRYTQQHGIDYDWTFSPVVKYESIRTVLAIAVQQYMSMVQFDIQSAFLHGSLDTEIYMQQPPSFEVGSQHPPRVFQLLKSLYGLKQSGRIWNQTFHDFLMRLDLESTEADPCVYISKTEPCLIIMLFVDDGIAACSSPARLEALVLYMEEHFAITRSNED